MWSGLPSIIENSQMQFSKLHSLCNKESNSTNINLDNSKDFEDSKRDSLSREIHWNDYPKDDKNTNQDTINALRKENYERKMRDIRFEQRKNPDFFLK